LQKNLKKCHKSFKNLLKLNCKYSKIIKNDKVGKQKMKISDVKIRLIKKDDAKLKAVASVVIEDCIALHDIKVIENDNGMFIAMPAKKTDNGTYRDIVHPINKETRDNLTSVVLDAYNKALEENE
jgi:stage V sporulation protein G